MTRDKVLAWCRKYSLFSSGETVYAALSGGADSVAMLHLLLSLREELGVDLRAAHYNHRLRGAASQRDEDFCRELCASWGVELVCGGGDVATEAARTGDSLELAARKARYGFFSALPGKTATAHTADDNLETLLMNLLRGAQLRGLGGIPPRRGEIVRPVLCLTRREIEAHLAGHGLSHIHDATNDEDFCLRNRLRRHVLPLLAAETENLPERALAMTEALRADETLLQAQADALLDAAAADGGWRVSVLSAAPGPVASRALRTLLERRDVTSLSAAHIRAAEALLSGGPSAVLALPDLTLRRQYDLLLCGAPDALSFEPFLLPLPGSHPLPGGRTLSCAGPFPYDGRKSLCLVLDAPPLARPRRPGDRLRLKGGCKTVKKWMIDRKIPAALRGVVPVLEAGGKILAVWGVGVDPSHSPAPGQPCFELQINIERYYP